MAGKTKINSQRNKWANDNWQLSKKNVITKLPYPVNKQ